MARSVAVPIELGRYGALPLVLCGFMGVGKSTVGRRLANRLERPFVDLDHRLEEQFGTSISALFQAGREAEFRSAEAAELQRLLAEHPPMVVALGGGAVEDAATRELLHERAFTIHIDQRFDDLIPALNRLRATRPLLAARSNEEIHALYLRRRANYLVASLTVTIARAGVARATRDVVTAINAFVEKDPR